VGYPTDALTATVIQRTESKLMAAIQGKCGGGELASLNACGADTASTGSCLLCTQWRRAAEAVRCGHGPN